MRITRSRGLVLAAVVFAMFSADRQAQATTITFDAAITTPIPGGPDCSFAAGLVCAYFVPVGTVPPIAFVTQGFAFGGFTDGVTAGLTFPGPSVVDGAVCSAPFVCDGHFLGTNRPLSLTTVPAGGGMALLSLMAASPPPSPGSPEAGTTLKVFGFRGVVPVASQTFTLEDHFKLFPLDNDSDWANIDRAVFEALTATGGPGLVALDNIVEAPIPEPASLMLLGTGLVGLVARRRAKRAQR